MLKFDESFVPLPSEKVRFVLLSYSKRNLTLHTTQPTGQESLAEKWIFHKLNTSTTIINQALAERNFMAASAEAYRFWLYDICDVYIVRPPPCFLFVPTASDP